ncbi:DUF4760 domain-containing protein [Pasteurellaceae bacterium 22721_9_1]
MIIDWILVSSIGTCIATGYLAIFANRQLKDQRLHHKQKSTIELLLAHNHNASYLEQRRKFVQMRKDGVNFTEIACHIKDKNSEYTENNATITSVLNSIEFICVGIRENIFDEAVYKRMSRSSLIYDWDTLKPYIMELRRINGNNDKLFCEFEWLATKWKDEQ